MNTKIVSLLLAVMLALPVQARNRAERAAFIRENPRPAGCVKCEVDHKVALMNGGADHRSNMQWLSDADHKVKTRQDFIYKKRSAGGRVKGSR